MAVSLVVLVDGLIESGFGSSRYLWVDREEPSQVWIATGGGFCVEV